MRGLRRRNAEPPPIGNRMKVSLMAAIACRADGLADVVEDPDEASACTASTSSWKK
jgi:hypothetical protein